MSETPAGLTPANQNPWYVLMTLYGEQEGEEVDWELHARNRAAWNAWACQGMGEEEREAAAKSSEVTVGELSAWPEMKAEVERRHRIVFRWRNRRNATASPNQFMPVAGHTVDLSSVEFGHHVALNQVVFSGDASFGNTNFLGYAFFRKVTFVRTAWFASARFNNKISFDGVTFIRDTWFGGATFSEDSGFANAKFIGQAGFSSATFSEDARFTNATFSGDAFFGGVTFSGEAGFLLAIFCGETMFAGAAFSGRAVFIRATFNGEALFRSAKFGGETIFGSATFNDFVNFSMTRFESADGDQVVNFADCQFQKPASFRDAIFHATYPDFSGATLHEKTTFTDHSNNWPARTKQDPTQAKASCAVIRHNLGKQGLPEAEHFFFRREMGFAGRSGPWLQRPPYWLFGCFSDYGYGILTPFLWLLLLIGAGGSVMAWGVAGPPSPIGFEQGLGLSFANVFNFLGFHKTFATEKVMSELSPLMVAFSGFQSIAGVILLFFLGLGLRTRFRLR